MTTRSEQKAAIESGLAMCEDNGFTHDAAILRAMLETFDEREDFHEAAKNHSKIATDEEIMRHDVAAWHDRSAEEQHAAYRRLVEKEARDARGD